MHGKQQDPHVWEAPGDFARRAKAIENRHGDIENYEVRQELESLR
jgi:hypothetical protein